VVTDVTILLILPDSKFQIKVVTALADFVVVEWVVLKPCADFAVVCEGDSKIRRGILHSLLSGPDPVGSSTPEGQ
jgi:hypothetical protein